MLLEQKCEENLTANCLMSHKSTHLDYEDSQAGLAKLSVAGGSAALLCLLALHVVYAHLRARPRVDWPKELVG